MKKITACPVCNRPLYYKGASGKFTCYICKKYIKPELVKVRYPIVWPMHKQAKRSVNDEDIISEEALVNKIKGVGGEKYSMNRALISFLYLTAARVQEVVGLVNQHTRRMKVGPVKKNQIQWRPKSAPDYVVIESLPVFKRRTKSGKPPRRNVPVLIGDDEYFCMWVKKYIDTLEDEAVLFPMTYQWAWKITSQIKLANGERAYNHYLRHLRLTHLVKRYGFTDLDLQQYVGWANTLMASKYTHLDWLTLAKKMNPHGVVRNGNN